MATSGTVATNNVHGSEGAFFDWNVNQTFMGGGNLIYTRINWFVGWRFGDADKCRALRNGYANINGVTIYLNNKPGNGVHSYHSTLDHRPKLFITSGTRDIVHDAQGKATFSAGVQFIGYPDMVSGGTTAFELPDVVPFLTALGQPLTVEQAIPLNVVTVGLTPLSPGSQEVVFSLRPAFRVGVFAPAVETVSSTGAILNLDVQYTPATDVAYSDAQFNTGAVMFSRVVTLTSRYSEILVGPDVDLPVGLYHWRVRWQTATTTLSGWTAGPPYAFTVAGATPYVADVHWRVDPNAPTQVPHLWQVVPARGGVGDPVTAYGFGFPSTAGLVTIAGEQAPIKEWVHNEATPEGSTPDRVIAPGVRIDCEHDLTVVTVPDVTHPGARFAGGPFVVSAEQAFQVQGRYLRDAYGSPMIVVGVEQRLEHVGHIPFGPDLLPEIAKTGASACRILVEYSSGGKYNAAEIDETIRAGLNGGMFIELTVDGGKNSLVYREPELLAIIKKWQARIAVHAVGESEVDTDAEWAAQVKSAVNSLRAVGITCPLYCVSRYFGRNLTCLIQKGAEVLAADPLHNLVFGWQAYWGQPPGTANPMDSMTGFYQGDNNMTLTAALNACAAAPFPIQIGLMHHSDPGLPPPDDVLVVPYQEMMAGCRARNLGWLWWDYREGADNLTPSGDFGDWTVYGQSVVMTDPNGIMNAAVRTNFQQSQIGQYPPS